MHLCEHIMMTQLLFSLQLLRRDHSTVAGTFEIFVFIIVTECDAAGAHLRCMANKRTRLGRSVENIFICIL